MFLLYYMFILSYDYTRWRGGPVQCAQAHHTVPQLYSKYSTVLKYSARCTLSTALYSSTPRIILVNTKHK